MFKELDSVKTLQALPAKGIAAATVGTIVEVFDKPSRAYMVEFADDDGETLAMPTLRADQIELVTTFEPTR